MTLDHDVEAGAIVAAHAEHRLLDPISDRVELTMADAYAIQHHVVRRRIEHGERRAGWKLGYTSQAMRLQMGVESPNFGPLTDAMRVASGGRVPDAATQPRVEPEVALVFGRDVEPGADRGAVLASVAAARACLEVVDSVWRDYRFRIEDNTADGSSACGFVLGDEIALDSIVTVDVRLLLDDIEVGAGRGADAGGHPADGVVWLVERLAERGERLGAGDVVLTGGLTRAVAIEPGMTVRATFDGTAGVSVRR